MAKYHYAVIAGVIPAPFPGDEKVAGPPVIFSPRVLLEHQLFDRKIRTERADLTDTRRVFRTRTENMWLFNKDATGYFLVVGGKNLYWSPTNPVTENDTFIRKWGPL